MVQSRRREQRASQWILHQLPQASVPRQSPFSGSALLSSSSTLPTQSFPPRRQQPQHACRSHLIRLRTFSSVRHNLPHRFAAVRVPYLFFLFCSSPSLFCSTFRNHPRSASHHFHPTAPMALSSSARALPVNTTPPPHTRAHSHEHSTNRP